MTVLYQLFINYQTSHLKKIILICKISYFLICLSIFHQANAFKNYKKKLYNQNYFMDNNYYNILVLILDKTELK